MLQSQNIEFDCRVLCRISHMDVSNTCMSYIEQILITRHIINVNDQLAFLEQYICRCKTKWNRNKQLYENHVKIGVRLLTLTCKFGCTTDSLYLALFLYINGKYRYSLKILEKKRKMLYQDYVFYSKDFGNRNAYAKKKWKLKKLWCLTSKFNFIQYFLS